MCSFLKNRGVSSQRGAYMVELAIALPLFLAVVFFLIWLGLALNARSAVVASVNTGVRLSITRGDSSLMGGEELIEEINYWLDGGSAAPFPAILHSSDINAQQAVDWYNDWTQLVFNGLFLEDLPPQYLYALAYVYESMRASVGDGMLSYPCDPNLPDSEGGGPGCLMCRFLNGGDPEDGLIVGPHRVCDGAGPCLPPENELGLECEYSSPQTILQIVSAIIGGTFGEPMIFRHRNYLF